MIEINGLDQWVAFLTRADLPVLKQTARELTALRENDDRLTAGSVAEIIARDPMMSVKLLRYLQQHKHRSQLTELVQVEQALLMLGIEPVFNKVPFSPQVEEVLKQNIAALPHMLRVVHRAQRAAEFAKDWAVRLRDLHYEEVRVAALLHDIAELLLWCYSPKQMLHIHTMQHNDKSLRSRQVQEEVLGFALVDLQRALVEQWELPKLLLTLMNDACSNQERVSNVVLAVNLARHSANGWDDAALPDDYTAIGELLRIPAEEVMLMVCEDDDVLCDISKPH
ncbi:MAG: HDOD domain-containing protein [Gallionella sp.]|nr:HDOD domain-containing protein [Gallionella sp.]